MNLQDSPAPDLKEEPASTRFIFLSMLGLFLATLLWIIFQSADPKIQSAMPIDNPPFLMQANRND